MYQKPSDAVKDSTEAVEAKIMSIRNADGGAEDGVWMERELRELVELVREGK